ncbi:RRM domain-containing protein [Meloidogyne graminicola]|uniref:RRM domain-containing protein n=1 Tax=Meloidogyne graminicola TaxID=189291 RepID=A0A8T0A4Q3_9BILA|nr:RRM domain-containing protein [Meloidogyne graminicola]
MFSVQIQKRLLEQMTFTIEGHNVELRIPSNRIFISRVPDETQPNELIQFVDSEIKKFDQSGYCVDVYFPSPFNQFAFCTVGGKKVFAKLAIKADYSFKNSSISISTCCDNSELDADNLLEQKIKEFVERNDYARIRSLQNISSEVKSMLQILAKMKKCLFI